jgi:clan AA aspartic protease (TIGR02281 family)
MNSGQNACRKNPKYIDTAMRPTMSLRSKHPQPRQLAQNRCLVLKAIKQLMVGLVLVMVATHPGAAESVQLEEAHGVYMIPVRINDAIQIPFVLDTGAGDVSVPEDVFKTLIRTRTVKESDFLAPATYVMADGSKQLQRRFILRELRVGDQVVKDVIASVAPDKADPLLGQSFLKKLPGWTIDYTQHTLVFGNAAPLPATTVGRPILPPAPIIAPAVPPQVLTVAEMVKRANAARYGFDRPKDYAEAMRWFRKAAEQGDAQAQNEIGDMYMKGHGVPRDNAQAMRWFRKAADQGLAKAKDNIGYLYFHGLDVPQDCVAASKWTGRLDTVLCDLPRVGDCMNTTIKRIGTRLGDWGSPTPGSGSAIEFANSGYQVGYDTVPAIEQSRVGDPVRICLEEIPEGCPIGDDRGRVYRVTNLRTNRSWSRADASHLCGGA